MGRLGVVTRFLVTCLAVAGCGKSGDDHAGTPDGTRDASSDSGNGGRGGESGGSDAAATGGRALGGQSSGGGGRSGGAGGESGGAAGDSGGTGTIVDAGTGAGPSVHDAATDGTTESVEAGQPGSVLGKFTLTYYWVTAEADFSGANDTTIYDSSCTALATVPSAFASSLDIEGTGRLADGRVVNVDGACACARSPCYMVVDAQHPWGYGVQGKALVPFRSIAVDHTVIPYGSHVYIREFDGVKMPGDASYGGFVHDGCFSADDTGGDIIGMHVDFFAALKANYTTLDGQLGLTQVTVANGGSRCP